METLCSEETMKYIWEGAIPLQIQLHESEITSIPPPPPLMILGLRIGYLPLLIAPLKAHFSSALPPGTDNVWFDYKGLPLKWYVPTGVLFDLLCAEPERPWNLTVHFRGSPGDVLTPSEGEESVKWSYINSLKEVVPLFQTTYVMYFGKSGEKCKQQKIIMALTFQAPRGKKKILEGEMLLAAYVINGNCKNVMNMSQADQYDLWQSLLKGNMEGYMKISSRLKLGPFGEYSLPSDESEAVASSRPCRIPVRLYVRSVGKEIVEIEDAPIVDSWDKISYINRPFEIYKEEGGYVSLKQAMKSLLPEILDTNSSQDEGSSKNLKDPNMPDFEDESLKLRLVRVQGIELDMDIPFFWVANCLKNPEFYLHICLIVSKQPKLR